MADGSLQSYAGLPEALRQVAEACGLDVARAVARAFGGRKVWVPQPERMKPGQRFTRALVAEGLTLDQARCVAEVFGGCYQEFPFGEFGAGRAAKARELRDQARRMLQRGAKKADIAAATGSTERWVYKVQKVDTDPDLPLFPKPPRT